MNARSALFLILLSVVVLGMGAARGMTQTPVSPQTTNEWTLAATGDAIVARRVNFPGDPSFDKVVEVLKQADAAFTNLEMSVLDLKEFSGFPREHGANLVGPPFVIEDLRDIGIDLFNRANNHTIDYGIQGMIETNRLLNRDGLAHAGSGMTLEEARAPAYFDTPRGRFALIGCASSFIPSARASNARREIRGRPGLSALRTTTAIQVSEATFHQLSEMRRQLQPLTDPFRMPSPEGSGEILDFFGALFKVGPKPGTPTYEMNKLDLEQILRWVRSAKRQADYVVVNIHASQTGGTREEPPDFLPVFAHAAIDAGADVFIGHGPHYLRGVEIYKGKAIYYGLGNFIFHGDGTIEPRPQDMYEAHGLGPEATTADLYTAWYENDTVGSPVDPAQWESVIPVARYREGEVEEIRFYPTDLGQKMGRSRRGTPRMADEVTAKRIIERLAQLSAPFGTEISMEQNVGVWKKPSSIEQR